MTNWYPISTLTLENEPVLFQFGEGILEGRLRVRKSKNIYQVKRDLRNYEDLLSFAHPWLWTPLDSEAWPLPLPDPITMLSKESLKRHEATGKSYFEDGDQLNTKVHLGRATEAPESLEECEARVWRAIRTGFVLRHQESRIGPMGHAKNPWPPKLMIEIRALHRWMESSKYNNPLNFRRGDWDDYDIDRSNAQALPARWEPTPRDISDYDTALLERWGDGLDRLDWRILYARAHLAQLSWIAIAKQEKKHVTTIKRRYQKAIQVMFYRAQLVMRQAA